MLRSVSEGQSGDEQPGALPPRERPAVAAGGLAITSVIMGVLAVLLGATFIWFFLALPFAVVAIATGLAGRRRTKRATGRAAGGIVTAGLVLGAAAIPVFLAGLYVIPKARVTRVKHSRRP
jgi:hypothetical protein